MPRKQSLQTTGVCAFCKKTFTAKSGAKFCSDTCRVKHFRIGDTAKKNSKQIMALLGEMGQLWHDYPHTAQTVIDEYLNIHNALKTLHTDVVKNGKYTKKLPL